jgi:hypothetical protein
MENPANPNYTGKAAKKSVAKSAPKSGVRKTVTGGAPVKKKAPVKKTTVKKKAPVKKRLLK